MTNAEIARVLRETAQLMLLSDENAFKARAYETAADAIKAFTHPVADLVLAGRAVEIEGVGKSIAQSLGEILATGTFAKREELLSVVPRGLLEMLRIKGLGPKKIQALWKERNITQVGFLRTALERGELDDMKGMGGKTKTAVLEAIAFYEAQRGRLRLPEAQAVAEKLLPLVTSLPGCSAAKLTGAITRSLPVVEAIEFVVAVAPAALTLYRVTKHLGTTSITYEPAGEYGTFHTYHPDGYNILLYETSPDNLESAALEHSYPEGTPPEVRIRLGPYPPEAWDYLANHPDTLDTTPPRLVEASDIRGILHAHSTYSDGQHTLRQMAEACIARGYEYLGITDHSRTAAYAGGLSLDKVQAQHQEIEALNAELAPFRIFKGIESDILQDGSLDYPDEVLLTFDFVIGSIHSGFTMTEAEATERLIRAAQHPLCTMLGHPTGRLLLAREGYPVNLKAVIDACADCGCAIELNSHPYRLDLDWQWLPYALQQGVKTSINPDAHSINGLDDVTWGLLSARKGMATPADALNCLNTQNLAAYFDARKQQVLG